MLQRLTAWLRKQYEQHEEAENTLPAPTLGELTGKRPRAAAPPVRPDPAATATAGYERFTTPRVIGTATAEYEQFTPAPREPDDSWMHEDCHHFCHYPGCVHGSLCHDDSWMDDDW